MYEQAISHLSPVWSHQTDILVDYAQGVYIYSVDGHRYLDFTSGIGVTSTGHCHPKVVAAIQDQAAHLLHGQANIVYHKPMLDLIDELLPIVPPGLDSFFFSNSGAEAVEAAVKLAKHATGRPNVIVFNGGFHGRTHLTMAMTTSKTSYRRKYQPLVPGIFVAPYPYAYYYGWDEETTLNFCIKELKKLLKSQTAPEETACMVVEPVLGEGGYVVPPMKFLPQLRQICDENGILLIADEVQSGFGRTGRYFAVEHSQTIPDVLIMAKGIASGLPLSGIATRPELAANWLTGSHGGTYGGNAIACAAAVATLEVMHEEQLVDNAARQGERLRCGLLRLQEKYPLIGDVRGLGLMVAVELVRDGMPDSATTKEIVRAAASGGLLLLTCGTYDNVIRWIPPLVVNENQIDKALEIFTQAMHSVLSY